MDRKNIVYALVLGLIIIGLLVIGFLIVQKRRLSGQESGSLSTTKTSASRQAASSSRPLESYTPEPPWKPGQPQAFMDDTAGLKGGEEPAQ